SPAGLAALAAAHVEAFALDLERGDDTGAVTGLASKVLVGGVHDGRNVWREDVGAAAERLDRLASLTEAGVAAASSCSLLHVPYDVEVETRLDEGLRSWLAFAHQKVADLVTLRRALPEGADAIAAQVPASPAAPEAPPPAARCRVPAVR